LPLSRISTASCLPLLAPDGTLATAEPVCVNTSASIVGLARESSISRALMDFISMLILFSALKFHAWYIMFSQAERKRLFIIAWIGCVLQSAVC
jgi:hypothetical protein